MFDFHSLYRGGAQVVWQLVGAVRGSASLRQFWIFRNPADEYSFILFFVCVLRGANRCKIAVHSVDSSRFWSRAAAKRLESTDQEVETNWSFLPFHFCLLPPPLPPSDSDSPDVLRRDSRSLWARASHRQYHINANAHSAHAVDVFGVDTTKVRLSWLLFFFSLLFCFHFPNRPPVVETHSPIWFWRSLSESASLSPFAIFFFFPLSFALWKFCGRVVALTKKIEETWAHSSLLFGWCCCSSPSRRKRMSAR